MTIHGLRFQRSECANQTDQSHNSLYPLEELQGELAAIRTRIEHTDRLIDQVVYRLYGLTEEEIAVVEGHI